MPKKFSVNIKAAAARARKKAVKALELAKKQQEIEDSAWREDNKRILKKQQKKDDQERKKQLALEKKAEVRALFEEEMKNMNISTKNTPPPKIPQASGKESGLITEKKVKEKQKIETHNRLAVGGEASGVSNKAAIPDLSTKEVFKSKHPEKRLKAAHAAYEERRLIELREQYPSLRLSQLKERIFKEWKKSPENPINQV